LLAPQAGKSRMSNRLFTGGTIILAERLFEDGSVTVENSQITAVHPRATSAPPDAEIIDLRGGYLAPGFVDLHVHGGAGADFMDGTVEAFRTVCRAHARHGTTSLLPTSTVARREQILTFLDVCRRMKTEGSGGAAILGAHFYGPYFAAEARGCHPGAAVRPPEPSDYLPFLEFADAIATATVAPELPGAEAFVRACRQRGIRCNAGHSHAAFEQVEAAIGWGVRHVDHLFCAMSDRARLRQSQPYPMRGGLMEATLFFEALTTEVIADGKHLSRELLALAHKIKGADRLALVTDCNRALDMPDGEYLFGPSDGGEPIRRRDGVGVMTDGKALASGVMGMDHAVRTFRRLTGAPLVEVVRMASLTPARIAGWDHVLGSIAPGKRADLLVLGEELDVRQVFLGGQVLTL
jgi:N-acetylglucosamine-6-phosphate deacetylase